MQDGAPDDPSDAKTAWAEQRTDWAEDRTVLANERTFAGWLRTGLASVAVAIGLKALFREAEIDWLPRAMATLFLVAAIWIYWIARNAAGRTQSRLNAHGAEAQPTRTYTLTAVILTVATVGVAVVLWRL
ncbi:DUF202 domain-containing protein [Tropicimonas sp. IMCC34011]|uniref:DUF202 domain-containing protein n=1 Tax=Tropicimonas sp. IMCC34011 TaxID=2248759 RepID=UPI000E268AA6|nr:DUF202 domain-containing protein [Tropicimonas sp. IMCC34011]